MSDGYPPVWPSRLSDWLEVGGLYKWSFDFVLFCSQVRIQLGQGSGVHVARTMLREEGLGAFYKVSASELGWISIFLCPFGSFGVGLLVFNCL